MADAQKIIVLTAGHGGSDPGAASLDGKFIEAREATRLRDQVARQLRESGAPVVTDGEHGKNWPLRDALRLIRRPGMLPLEIHFNAGPAQASGVEVLAVQGWAKASRVIARTVSESLGLPLRGDGGWRPDNAGQHHRLAWCQAGGMLLEVCFLSNPTDLNAYAVGFSILCDRMAHILDILSKGENP